LQGVTLELRGFLELDSALTDVVASIRKAFVDDLPSEFRIHIGRNVFINVSEQFPGANIRNYYALPVTEEGELPELRPSKKGVYLQLKELIKLREMMPLVYNYLPELCLMKRCPKTHSGQEEFARCSFCCPLGSFGF
jgi:hypothetical protein